MRIDRFLEPFFASHLSEALIPIMILPAKIELIARRHAINRQNALNLLPDLRSGCSGR
jgi:hypothetical protein